MPNKNPDLYPNFLEKLYDSGIYQLDFSDITDYIPRLEPNIYYIGTKSEENRSDELNKDTHRNGFEENCYLNILGDKFKKIKLTYQTDANLQKQISLDKLNFKNDDLLGLGRENDKTLFLKHRIFLIIHMLYTRHLESLITRCYQMKNKELQEEIIYVLRKNGVHFKFLKQYRKKSNIEEIRKLLRNIHLTTLIFDQNMFGDFMMKILKLHAKLINVDPEKMFFEGIFQKRIPEMRKALFHFNISPEGEIISIDLQIKNTFIFVSKSSNIKSGGKPISSFYHLGDMKEISALDFDTVQYQLDSNFEVCLTPKKSPITLAFKLESFLPEGFKVPVSLYQCRVEPFIIPKLGQKTKKRKGKRTRKKRKSP